MRIMREQRRGKKYEGIFMLLLLMVCFLEVSACGRQEGNEEALMMRAENAQTVSVEPQTLALVLTSREGPKMKSL